MSITSEITRLQGVKSDIIGAIIDKGIEVPSGAMLDQCAGLIAQISGSGVSFTLRPIIPVSGNKIIICDESGNIGFNSLPVYAPSAYTSYAIVVSGVGFSASGLGTVTIIVPGASEIGGRTYRTVTINGVTWLAENLDYKASEIVINTTGSTSTPAAWYYNRDESTYGINGKKYGLLYNWYAAKYLHDNRAVLMPGWHLPSTSEWDALATAVGGDSVSGTKLKSTSGWSSGNGTDDFGFSVLPAGYYENSGFDRNGTLSDFWTSAENSSSDAHDRYFTSTKDFMGTYISNKTDGFSVRLVKDS